MEVESKPEEIESLDRRIIQLKIEREALKRENDQASQDRLERLEADLANLEQQSAELTTRWQAEKEKTAAAARPKDRLDPARLEPDQAQRGGDPPSPGELSSATLPSPHTTPAHPPPPTHNHLPPEDLHHPPIPA